MASQTRRLLHILDEIIRYGYEAIGAYDEAVRSLLSEPVRRRLVEFRGRHAHELSGLTQVVRDLGGDPSERPANLGVTRDDLEPIAGEAMGSEDVMQRLRRDIAIVHAKVRDRRDLEGAPQDVLGLVRRYEAELAAELAWIDRALRERAWEHPART